MRSISPPKKPDHIEATGIAWRKRANHWAAYWVCRHDIVQRGYEIKSRALWPLETSPSKVEPIEDEWLAIGSACALLQDEMINWANGRSKNYNPYSLYDGTLGALGKIYLVDPDSPFQALRYNTKITYEKDIAAITREAGGHRLRQMTFRSFKHLYESFRAPKAEGNLDRVARAHGMMTRIRLIMSFGVALEIKDCIRLQAVLKEMEFETPKKRGALVNAAQAVLIRKQAHAIGRPSIALVQAIQFELSVRQKDAIGEWVPVSEPGVSSIIDNGDKWMLGLDWKEVDENLILRHRISKSLRGRNAVTRTDAGNVEEYDLKAYPMIMEELALIPAEARTGPMVKAEHSGLPWRQKVFAAKWRKVARAAGIPDHVQNRDSRAGGITEGRKLGARLEDLRHHAGHAQISMTARYDKSDVETKNVVANIRSKGRRTDSELG